MTDIDGYEPNDPKSPGYHDRMADVWDARDKTDPREYARRSPSGVDGAPLARTADQAREAEAEDAWRRESDDVARTVALSNLRHHGTIDAAPPERTTCPNCGTHVHPAEKTVGDITYFNCRRCDFSTWDWGEYLKSDSNSDRDRITATDEEIERSFDAYR